MVDLGTAPPETPQAAYERYRKVRFFGSLNGLRFLCIGMVLWHHSPILRSLDEPETCCFTCVSATARHMEFHRADAQPPKIKFETSFFVSRQGIHDRSKSKDGKDHF